MSSVNISPPWFIAGASVMGASHLKLKMPNQDAISWWPESGGDPPLIMAISDGHGSPKSIRSQIGSRLAVENTLNVLKDFADDNRSENDLISIQALAKKEIPGRIENLWKQSVKEHMQEIPFSMQEQETLHGNGIRTASDHSGENILLAYGATLLGVLLTKTFVLYLQLGDGDILNVMPNGDVVRPIPGGDRFLGNETTSLCSDSSAREISILVQSTADTFAELILLSTDGYANSFCNEEEFLKVGPDLLTMIRCEGVEPVRRDIGEWLAETTRMGSGDDITLGMIGRQPLIDNRNAEASQ